MDSATAKLHCTAVKADEQHGGGDTDSIIDFPAFSLSIAMADVRRGSSNEPDIAN
jgi:hypothetical protein